MTHKPQWDPVRREWRLPLDDGLTVLVAKDLWRLERALDLLEARRSMQDAVPDKEDWSINRGGQGREDHHREDQGRAGAGAGGSTEGSAHP